jgi:predicted RNA-binding Zn ribbon-like protein
MDPLWAELINSDWRDYRGSGRREDRLLDAAWLAPFLARTGWPRGRLPGRAERERLRRLRTLLRRVVDAIRARQAVGVDDIAAVNRILSGGAWALHLALRRGSWQLATEPSSRGIARVEVDVAWSFASMLAEGDPARIKVCANPDCGWVMYDESRNRTRQWCEASECGNLINVRRFRQRRRTETDPASSR